MPDQHDDYDVQNCETQQCPGEVRVKGITLVADEGDKYGDGRGE